MRPDFYDNLDNVTTSLTDDIEIDNGFDVAFVFTFNTKDYNDKYRQKLEYIISNLDIIKNYLNIAETKFYNEYAYITINLCWNAKIENRAKEITNILSYIYQHLPIRTFYILNKNAILFKSSKNESNKFDNEILKKVQENINDNFDGNVRTFGPHAVFGRNERLRLVNLNSTIDITSSIYQFVNSIQKSADVKLRVDYNFCLTINDDIKDKNENDIRKLYRPLAFFLSQTIIFLVDEEKIEKDYELNHKNCRYLEYGYTKDNVLGLYFTDCKEINGVNRLVIEICPERIEKEIEKIFSNRGNIEIELDTITKLVYTIVILHELAHALLDETNYAILSEENEPLLKKNVRKPYGYSEEFRFVMEESLANAIMLIILSNKNVLDGEYKKQDETLFEIVKRFVYSQPLAYRFGLKQFEAKVTPCKWRTMKDKITQSKAEEWLEKYFVNNEPYSAEAFDKLFE